MTSRRLTLVAIAALGLGPSFAAQAQQVATDWPQKPIKIVVPYAPGGSADTLGRLIGKHLGEAFKQTVVVENKAGAGGLIGSQLVAKAAPDGYTLVVSGIGSHVIAPVDQPAGFDPMKDFSHIAMLAGPPLAVAVNAELPVKDFAGLVSYIRANPKGLSWGSPGQGTHGHLTGELFRTQAKLNMVHIAYKGAGPAVADLIANQIPAAFMTLISANAHVAELGYPGLTGTTWFALSGPAGMAPALVEKINAEVRRGMHTAAVKAVLQAESMETIDLDPAAFTRYVQSEIDRWTPAVKSVEKTGK